MTDSVPEHTLALHLRALDAFGDKVDALRDEQWGVSTPCAEWDVRQLVGHLVDEQLWAAPLLQGMTIAEAQEHVPGDPLGDDPKVAWRRAAAVVRAVLDEPGVVGRTVELSAGPTPAADYLAEMTTDLVVHGWDLARPTGQDEGMDGELLEVTWARVEPHARALQASDMFGDPVPVPPSADLQTRLLALLGRKA